MSKGGPSEASATKFSTIPTPKYAMILPPENTGQVLAVSWTELYD